MPSPNNHVIDFLRAATYRREAVDRFLDKNADNWATFDPVLGYTLCGGFFRDGENGCRTLQRYAPSGERMRINFPEAPCRINTYGDSFTQGAQVSDGETWQEALAAHFCEPIRNYGIGGHGVYQAYRRLLREESGPNGADYIILTIWGDDHHRSINAWRWLTYFRDWNRPEMDYLFHSNPWDYVRISRETGKLVERPTRFNRPQDLYLLTDPEFVITTFRQDPIVRLLAAIDRPESACVENLKEFAEMGGVTRLSTGNPSEMLRSIWGVYTAYAHRCTRLLMEKLAQFVASKGKKLIVVFSYPEYTIKEICSGRDRSETTLPDWHPPALQEAVRALGIPTIDILPFHQRDFAATHDTADEYAARYYIGHYNARGNRFFAESIREEILRWLEPAPPAYRTSDDVIRFHGYLPGDSVTD